jgi:hypothetical protein
MVVHSLHVPRRKNQYPGFQVFPPVKIDAALAFLSLLGDFRNILDFPADLLFGLVDGWV